MFWMIYTVKYANKDREDLVRQNWEKQNLHWNNKKYENIGVFSHKYGHGASNEDVARWLHERYLCLSQQLDSFSPLQGVFNPKRCNQDSSRDRELMPSCNGVRLVSPCILHCSAVQFLFTVQNAFNAHTMNQRSLQCSYLAAFSGGNAEIFKTMGTDSSGLGTRDSLPSCLLSTPPPKEGFSLSIPLFPCNDYTHDNNSHGILPVRLNFSPANFAIVRIFCTISHQHPHLMGEN